MYVFRILSQNAILFFNLKKGKARPISSVLFWNFVLGNPTNVLSPLSPCAHTDHVSGTLEFSKALNRLGENMIVRDDEPDDVGAAFQKFAVVTKELANLMKNMVGSIPLQQYPTTTCGGMQNGSSVGICTRFIHVFLHVWRRLACSVGAYQQNFCVGDQEEVYLVCVVGWGGGVHLKEHFFGGGRGRIS